MTELVNFNKNMAVKDNLIKDFLRIMSEKEKSKYSLSLWLLLSTHT